LADTDAENESPQAEAIFGRRGIMTIFQNKSPNGPRPSDKILGEAFFFPIVGGSGTDLELGSRRVQNMLFT
jgi:hypothetical protein